MTSPAELGSEISAFIDTYGQQMRIRYYTLTYSGTDYDQEFLTKSGSDLWTSGVKQQVNNSKDFRYIEQGKVLLDDSKFYFNGDINLGSGTIKIGVGSPVNQEYKIIEDTTISFLLNGTKVYNKVFGRILINGSFVGEY